MDEARAKSLLEEELVGKKRVSFLERLHQRYCALRTARERAEILGKATAP